MAHVHRYNYHICRSSLLHIFVFPIVVFFSKPTNLRTVPFLFFKATAVGCVAPKLAEAQGNCFGGRSAAASPYIKGICFGGTVQRGLTLRIFKSDFQHAAFEFEIWTPPY